jgi:Fe-S-cluster formation regulator IscX/YfhJ
MGAGGHDLIAQIFEVFEAIGSGVFPVGLFVNVDPAVGPEDDIGINLINIPAFDDVQVLDPEAVATADHRAGVVRLEDILDDHAQVACAEVNMVQKPFLTLGCQQFQQEVAVFPELVSGKLIVHNSVIKKEAES